MAIDVDEVRQRAERHASRDDERVTQPERMEVGGVGGGGGWIPVVLRSIDAEAGTMQFQYVDYADSPPVIGQYEAYGEIETGYPLPTATLADYEQWIWPEQIEGEGEEEPVDNPISTLTVPLLALKNRYGDWILMIPLKGDGSLLPVDEPVNECSFG